MILMYGFEPPWGPDWAYQNHFDGVLVMAILFLAGLGLGRLSKGQIGFMGVICIIS
jgi:4-amino-4-deoxy-L-arabinose transferase-like glycosyltransferase